MALADNNQTDVEQQLREAILTGQLVDLRTGQPEQDDPARGGEWETRRVVAAALLTDLLTSPGSSGRPRALRLAGARIVGILDLEATTLICPLLLLDCSFEQQVNLSEAEAPAVRMPGCHVPILYAAQLKTRGNVELDNGFTARGVDLSGAHLGGNLTFSGDDDVPGAHLTNPGGHALFAADLTVEGNMWCRSGFTADGQVDLMGARIGGELSFTNSTLSNPGDIALQAQGVEVGQDLKCRRKVTIQGMVSLLSAHIHGNLDMFQATLANPEGHALSASRLTVDGDMDCSSGFTAQGAINLSGAHIGGNLDFSGDRKIPGAHLSNPGGTVLFAEGLTVEGNMWCRSGFTADGQVDLMGARIGAELSFSASNLSNPGGIALQAQAIEVGQDLKCRNDVTIQGEVSLLGAHIHGDLNLYRAHLANPGGLALYAQGLTVGRDMDCSGGFTAEGEINLLNAHIGSNLAFDGASLTNAKARALHADGLAVDQNLLCRREFTAQGEVRLLGANIRGTLGLEGATLTNPGGMALDLERARMATLFLRSKARPEGTVELINAQVDTCYDDQATWPQDLRLVGFNYAALVAEPEVDAEARLRWLELDGQGYSPQPYEQLAAVYRRAGRDQDARTVALGKQRARRRALAKQHGHHPIVTRSRQAWSLLLDALVGYGYRTWLAGVWLLGFVLAGWWIFDRAHPTYLITTKPPGERPLFHGGLYALDLLLPIGDLNYQGAWIARGWARGFWLAWILAGWVLTTAVLAALAGILKRD
jgi:hypothetical protein